jgi:fumarylpyruvate hydrolase
MSAFVIDPPARPVVPVEGDTAVFPVRRIYCVGQNYAAHKAEMGNGDDRDPPFFFAKPADAVVPLGARSPYPTVATQTCTTRSSWWWLNRAARIAGRAGLDHVFGYAVGRRPDPPRPAGRPRPRAGRGMRPRASTPAPRSPPSAAGPAPRRTARSAQRQRPDRQQDSKLDDMIWNVAEIIAEASKLWTLAAGDLIFTGTPEGVGPWPRRQVDGEVEGVGKLSFKIV